MTRYTDHFNTKRTNQREKTPGRVDEVENNAGGYVFEIDEFARLNRFLILGSEENTYYQTSKKLTVENAKNVIKCIQEDGLRTVKTIAEVSQDGRAPKNDPAIFALALCATFGDAATKKAAYEAITDVCRIGTHIFNFCGAIQDLRGWSGGLRRGVAKFYTEADVDRIALQLVKYRQRNGWTHQDVLRLSHAKPTSAEQNGLFKWAVGKANGETPHRMIEGFQKAQTAETTKEIVSLVKEYRLPWEAIPTQFTKEKDVLEALLPKMGITALIRQLGKLTAAGVFNTNLDSTVKDAVAKISDEDILRKGRVHPLNILVALDIYRKGRGLRGNLTWKPVQNIIDALDEAFYTSFKFVEPTGLNWLLGVDVSGSMDGFWAGWGDTAQIAGTHLVPRECAAAMTMLTARTEKNHEIMGFSTSFMDLGISPRMRLDQVVNKMKSFRMGGTDCAQPMLWATKHKVPVDVFVIYTDSETWAGDVKPFQALQDYRQKLGRDAKLIVQAFTSTGFSIADPNDPGMLDVCGFDAAAAQIMGEFARGNV